ncbi:MAG: hypothetical protein ABS81_27740 [Pseudonocardia sp. SCN 72-86]|nr:MAG: hypothetical protein ABS81_27740 [Pseudonocardia sp. SCN 72-86]
MTTAAAAPLPLLDTDIDTVTDDIDAGPSGIDGTDTSRTVIPAPRAPEPGPVAIVVPAVDAGIVAGIDAETETDADADAEAEPDGPAEMIEALVGDAVAGDTRARDALLSVIHPMVLRYCRARLGRQECVVGAAEDVAQDVCLAVVRALPNYTVKGLSFRAFVYGIAAHKVTDAFRAIGRNRSEPVPDVPDSVSAAEGPEHRALAVELGERLGELLHTLTPRQREVIVLRVAVGLSAEETAHAVGSTPGAVRVTQHRALTRLRQVLVEHEAAALLADSPLGGAVAAAAADPAAEQESDFRVG